MNNYQHIYQTSTPFNAEIATKQCVSWIRSWFATNGKDCKAIIGISGGKDSSVAAALCVEALGKDRVIGVLMPNGVQCDLKDAYEICRHLNVPFVVANISPIYNTFVEVISRNNANFVDGQWTVLVPPGLSEQANINLSPRIRMTMLYAISQSVNGRVVCTDNLSESYIGYSTRWGDNVGDFCPLVNFTSEEVMAIGDYLGLPYELVHKTPSDGLCGKTDEDRFGFTYEVLNRYIRTGVCDDEAIKAKIDAMHRNNLFKLRPISYFKYETDE